MGTSGIVRGLAGGRASPRLRCDPHELSTETAGEREIERERVRRTIKRVEDERERERDALREISNTREREQIIDENRVSPLRETVTFSCIV